MLTRTEITDPASGLSAHVVVDSLQDGRAMGGVRFTPSVDATEVGQLARQMTLKLALAGLPIGGAKAGIVAPPTADAATRQRLLEAFGRSISPLLHGGVYLGTDQGMTYADRAVVFAAAGYDVAAAIERRGGRLPIEWTALWGRAASVTGWGVASALQHHLARRGLEGPRRVAVQGFGTVGRGVATHLAEAGHRLVAIADVHGTVIADGGLDVAAMIAVTDAAGSIDRTKLPRSVRSAGHDAWRTAGAEVVVLAAGGGAIDDGNVGAVDATVIVEAANCGVTDAAAWHLHRRDVDVLPGIIANGGAAIVTGLMLTDPPRQESADRLVAALYGEVRSRIVAAVDRLHDGPVTDEPLTMRAQHQALALAGGGAPLVGAA